MTAPSLASANHSSTNSGRLGSITLTTCPHPTPGPRSPWGEPIGLQVDLAEAQIAGLRAQKGPLRHLVCHLTQGGAERLVRVRRRCRVDHGAYYGCSLNHS